GVTGGATGTGGTGGSNVKYVLRIQTMVVVVSHNTAGDPKPGPVTSVPTGITCGGSFINTGGTNNGHCEESYASGTSVVLTAQGTTVVNFTAWQGDCSGTNPVIPVVRDRARGAAAGVTPLHYGPRRC